MWVDLHQWPVEEEHGCSYEQCTPPKEHDRIGPCIVFLISDILACVDGSKAFSDLFSLQVVAPSADWDEEYERGSIDKN